ncbi:ABC transporter ATP-binding protein [Actinobaculum suis]|uniref:ABC transporter ATP-binding protein n=1 Tax=Actinobaculum suis TaxID=1657 RepID=A0A7Z8YB78_9ACTO|nr:ATP-binding cassette domain-containing protein [Actinobaculum suis]VDG76937.1 ABC transporter ATP-binding protein [Actinobaculum suis]
MKIKPGRVGAAAAGAWRIATMAFLTAGFTAGAKLVAASAATSSRSTYLWVAGICIVLAGLCAFAEKETGGAAARAEERRLRRSLLEQTFALSAAGSTKVYSAGRTVPLLTSMVERVTEYRQGYLGVAIASLLVPFGVLFYIGIAIDPVVGFGVMVAVPLIPVLLGLFMRFFRKSSAANRRRREELSAAYLDAIKNMSLIRLCGAGERVEKELARRGEANRLSIMRILAGNQVVIIVVDGLCGLLLICLAAGLVVARAAVLTPESALAAVLLTTLLLDPLSQVAGFFYIGMGGRAAARAISTYQKIDPHGSGGHRDSRGRSDSGGPAAELAISAQGLSFDYGRGPVLREVSLEVRRGEKVAIIGPSGAGKSTLMGLLRGALAPQTGTIRVGAEVASPGDPGGLRQASAVVAQNTWMFTGTIAENMRFAAPQASEAEIWQALSAAHIAEEVRAMPHGLQTYIGEDAAMLSGGQAQRIALARALLSGRKILLLDEPTSQIDLESEAHIIDAISGLPPEWTVVLITHRSTLASLADTVYEIDAGRLQHASNSVDSAEALPATSAESLAKAQVEPYIRHHSRSRQRGEEE